MFDQMECRILINVRTYFDIDKYYSKIVTMGVLFIEAFDKFWWLNGFCHFDESSFQWNEAKKVVVVPPSFSWNSTPFQETVIGCRPTHPGVSMTFFKEEMNITDKLGGMLLKYDPKIGLVIMEGRISFHSGAQKTTV